jgi:hypothetical protein
MDLAGVISSVIGVAGLVLTAIGLSQNRRQAEPRAEPSPGEPVEHPSASRLAWVGRHAAPFLVGGFVFLAVGVAILLLTGGGDGPEPTGEIVSPASGDSVGRDIEVRGVLADIPEDQHVWLVVRDGNRLYPQDSEVTPPDGQWSLSFHQGGVTKSISLELYRMSDEGNRFINERFNAGNFSGISRIPGAVRLDVVENLRIRA